MFESHALEADHGCSFLLGPLRLDCQSTSRGLWTRVSRGEDPLMARGEVLRWIQRPDAEAPVVMERIWPGLLGPLELSLEPRLADRPIVTRPEIEASLAPGLSTEVFFGSPIWLGVSVGARQLLEVPVWRPSDTWFGPDTTRGILAYAGRTRLRRERDELVLTQGRVATQATIINRQSHPVVLDHVALPMPAMRTFIDTTGRLWSDAVTVLCVDDGEARVTVESPVELDGSPLRRVAAARVPTEAGSMFGAFSAVLKGAI